MCSMIVAKKAKKANANGTAKKTISSSELPIMSVSEILSAIKKNPRQKINALITFNGKEDAEKFYEATYKLDRPIRKSHVNMLSHDMKSGQWKTENNDALIVDWDGYRLNGQHRLLAIADANVPITMEVRCGWNPESHIVLDSGTHRTMADRLTYRKVDAIEKFGIKGNKLTALIKRTINGNTYTSIQIKIPKAHESFIYDWLEEGIMWLYDLYENLPLDLVGLQFDYIKKHRNKLRSNAAFSANILRAYYFYKDDPYHLNMIRNIVYTMISGENCVDPKNNAYKICALKLMNLLNDVGESQSENYRGQGSILQNLYSKINRSLASMLDEVPVKNLMATKVEKFPFDFSMIKQIKEEFPELYAKESKINEYWNIQDKN